MRGRDGGAVVDLLRWRQIRGCGGGSAPMAPDPGMGRLKLGRARRKPPSTLVVGWRGRSFFGAKSGPPMVPEKWESFPHI